MKSETKGEMLERLMLQSYCEIMLSNKQRTAKRKERIRKLLIENPNITPYQIAVIENGSKHFARGQAGGMVSRIKATIKKIGNECHSTTP